MTTGLQSVGFQGISFPFRFTPGYTGGVLTSTTTVSSFKHIEEAIRQIVGTYPGERWLNHNFGAAPIQSPGEPMDFSTASHLESFLLDQLKALEDRAEFPLVTVNFDQEEGILTAFIAFVVRYSLAQGQVTVEIDSSVPS